VSATLALLTALAAAAPAAVAPETAAAPAPTEPESAAAPETVATPEGTAPEEPEAVEPEAAEPEPEPEPEPEATEPEPETSGEVLTVAVERDGPPYYTDADMVALRKRYELKAEPDPPREPARWRCLIADPTCRTTFEINATSAYAARFQQGDVRTRGANRWNSGRAQYDFWLNFPTLVEQEGTAKYTKMTLGPKGGVIFSDTGDLWGNLGMAGRYWLGRGRFAPAIEFSSALAFKLGTRSTSNLNGADPKFQMQRGPVGFTADVGVGIGGFGAIVVGGQYDSPLAREEVPERFRTSAGGMVFLGFRGNIVWGGPAAAAVLTHGLTQRLAKRP
jgi:hypothetical protein